MSFIREIKVEKVRQPDSVIFEGGRKLIGDIVRCCVKDEDSGLFAGISFFFEPNAALDTDDAKALLEEGFRTCEQSINKRKSNALLQ